MRSLLFLLLFCALFTVIIGVIIIYMNSAASVARLEKGLGRSVTINGIDMYVKGLYSEVPLPKEAMDIVKNDEYVETYNTSYIELVVYKDMEKIKGEKTFAEELEERYGLGNSDGSYGTTWGGDRVDSSVYFLVDTELDLAFTLNGYKLLKGAHLKEDSPKNACLISKELAELNNLDVGDSFSAELVAWHRNKDDFGYDFVVRGIFEGPTKGEYWVGDGVSPSETIFANISYCMEQYEEASGEPFASLMSVTAYLKSEEDIEPFIENMKEKLNVRRVLDTHFGWDYGIENDLAEMDYYDVYDYYVENEMCDIVIDREWYDMVAEPMERISSLMQVMMIGLIAAGIVLFVLISLLSLKGRNRELGILLAMGEKRGKIILQVVIEQIVPLLLAAAIGIGLGASVGTQMIKSISDQVYAASAYDLEMDNVVSIDAYMQEEKNESATREWLHEGIFDIASRQSGRITVVPNIEAEVNMEALTVFAAAALMISLVALAIQMAVIMRIKPARILTDS